MGPEGGATKLHGVEAPALGILPDLTLCVLYPAVDLYPLKHPLEEISSSK